MCLAIPGRITAILDDTPVARLGRVDFGGVAREVNLTFVPEAGCGDYVLVHVGFGISVIDEAAALRIFEELAAIGEAGGFRDASPAAETRGGREERS